MANYDLKYASYVFYGDKTILKNIPKIQADKLKLREEELHYYFTSYL